MPSPIQLVVGLGNPGPKYSETRHNAGFWFVERLAAARGVRFAAEPKFGGDTARLTEPDCRLLKPGTYMNESGRAVQLCMRYFGISVDRVLVVHDEVDFEPGTARLKRGGGHGGHNGLRDLIACIGPDFLRLRLGVGHPGGRDEVVSYVLNRPGAADRRRIDDAMDRALEVMPLVLEGEFEKAMTRLHTAGDAAAPDDNSDGI